MSNDAQISYAALRNKPLRGVAMTTLIDRNIVLRILDALAEWLMRQELRVINRAQPRR